MPKILIVEDEPIIALQYELMVQKMGYEVIEKLHSGEEAIAFIKEQKPDIILMDIRLEGEINGIETMAQINKERTIPVVFISANPEYLKDEELGKDDFVLILKKPVSFTDMHACLKQLAEKNESL